jgi:Ca-activated chloride channel homolog
MYLLKRDTMRLLNNAALAVFFCILFSGSVLSWGQNQQNQGTPSFQPTPLPADIDPADPALPAWMRPSAPSEPAKNTNVPRATNAPSNIPPVQQPSQQAPQQGQPSEVSKGSSGVFTMHKTVENVTLPVTVVDDKKHLVTDLKPSNFIVYEDDQPQEIIDFRREDLPVSIGILVDNSGSMREKRQKVTVAVLNLIRASNPSDEAFIVNFNDEPYLDQEFTSDLNQMHEALDRLDARGGTALYDAVVASADHLSKAAKRDKKVLLVITDGEDNESRESLEQAIRAVQDENGPTIYTIGLLGADGKERRARHALEALSTQTGGVAFFPKTVDEVETISAAVARDIRNQYSITYKPRNPQSNGGFRHVKVVARASGYRELQVRTKNGYFAGTQRAAAR